MNTKAIRDLTAELDTARAKLAKEREILLTMELKNGQDCGASVSFCGKQFSLAYMSSYYMPAAVKQLNTVRLALIDYQKACVSQHEGAVGGLEWKVKQAVKGGVA